MRKFTFKNERFIVKVMNKKYPLKLNYVAKNAIWAGKRLKNEFGKESENDTISETWELTVRRDEMSRILNGESEGKTLAEYFEENGYDCVTPDFKSGDRFPLLIKLIDAEDVLSVQVHPDDEYAKRVEGDSGKTEMWHVIDAKEGAKLIYGLKPGIGQAEFSRAVAEGRIGEVVNEIDVAAGDTYFIPAGMVHAIGAGILIAEIQQNADLTYRVYDFDRVGADGKKRELHIEKALDVTRAFSEDEINSIRYSKGHDALSGELLANSEFFSVRKLTLNGQTERLDVTAESFLSILCTEGEGKLTFGGEDYSLSRGDSYFLPAGMGECDLTGRVMVIISSC